MEQQRDLMRELFFQQFEQFARHHLKGNNIYYIGGRCPAGPAANQFRPYAFSIGLSSVEEVKRLTGVNVCKYCREAMGIETRDLWDMCPCGVIGKEIERGDFVPPDDDDAIDRHRFKVYAEIERRFRRFLAAREAGRGIAQMAAKAERILASTDPDWRWDNRQ